MNRADYVVVGSGLTGAVIARTLTDAGREVIVLDRRNHLGGNVHDFVHASGIRIHTYGPHYFRTNSPKVWDFVNRFADFYRYDAEVASLVDGRIERWPVSTEYIERTVGNDWRPAFTGKPQNFEEASLAMMPADVYHKFVKGYSEKQWGVPARCLDAQLAGRFEVRDGDDRRLKKHRHQGIPVDGYAAFMKAMLDGIPVTLECDYLQARDDYAARRMLVFTGPIDEFFEWDLGKLHYRGQRREHTYLPDTEQHQPVGQVNNPDPHNGPTIRTLEWKHMMNPDQPVADRGTVITTETPHSPTEPGEYEYPFPDAQNRELYARYRARARQLRDVMICGRLGEYRYYDMDQAIARAMLLVKRLLPQ
jgi:UDP-galactopyranose mutase